MWKPATEHPPIGARITALYNDGSGAALLRADGEDQFTDETGDTFDEALRIDFSEWALLPDGFLLFFERNHDEYD